MTTFLNGPAEGCTLALRRAPLYLRVVRSRNGKWDALDQLDDEPKPSEQVHVYVKVKDSGGMFVRCSPRSASGYYAVSEYALCHEQPSDADVRDRDRWQAWAGAQAAERHPSA